MFFSSGLSNYSISLFHLFNHAFFKALLFLSMGSIIHAMSDEQDFRRMGGLVKLLPFTYTMVLIGSLSLMGFPFLTGFFSKDFLLEFTYSRYTIDSLFFFLLGLFAAFFTAFYSARLIYWVFLSKPNFYKIYLNYIHEPSYLMSIPMFILGLCSIFVGYLFSEAFNGVGTSFFLNSIYINVLNYSVFDAEFSLFFVKYMPLIVSIFGVILFFYLNKKINIYFFLFKYDLTFFFYKFFVKALFFDIVFVDFYFFFLLKFSYLYIYKYIEKRSFEFIFMYYFIFIINKIYKYILRFDKGLVFHFIFLIVLLFVFFFLLFEFLIIFDLVFMLIIILLFILNFNNKYNKII
jgi:NADH-ubiquinone oxidoreductase chain 5